MSGRRSTVRGAGEGTPVGVEKYTCEWMRAVVSLSRKRRLSLALMFTWIDIGGVMCVLIARRVGRERVDAMAYLVCTVSCAH